MSEYLVAVPAELAFIAQFYQDAEYSLLAGQAGAMLPRRGTCSMHAACSGASDLCPWVKCLRNFELLWFHVWFWKSFQKISSQPLICFKQVLSGIWYFSFLAHLKPEKSKLKLQGMTPRWQWPELTCNRWAVRLCQILSLLLLGVWKVQTVLPHILSQRICIEYLGCSTVLHSQPCK